MRLDITTTSPLPQQGTFTLESLAAPGERLFNGRPLMDWSPPGPLAARRLANFKAKQDAEKQRVYNAEHSFRRRLPLDHPLRQAAPASTDAELQALVAEILTKRGISLDKINLHRVVLRRRGTTWSFGGGNWWKEESGETVFVPVVQLGQKHTTLAVLLHELAHVLVRVFVSRRFPGHGRMFRAIHLDLLHCYCGDEIAQRLHFQYLRRGLCSTPASGTGFYAQKQFVAARRGLLAAGKL